MEDCAFDQCQRLDRVIINDISAWCESSFETPEANPTYNASIVHNATHKVNIEIPEGTTKIGSYVLVGSIYTISIPSTVTEIDETAFGSAYVLQSFTVDENNPEFSAIDGVLFDKKAENLLVHPTGNAQTSYTVPDGVKTIKNGAFQNDRNLISIIFPQSLEEIEGNAFQYCSSLENIFYKGTQEEWANVTIGEESQINDFPVHYEATTHVKSDDGVYPDGYNCGSTGIVYITYKCKYCDYVFEKVQAEPGHIFVNNICKVCGTSEYAYTVKNDEEITITKYNGGKRNVEIPSYIDGFKVTQLGSEAFRKNAMLTTVNVPSTVKVIGQRAFEGCSNLTSITLNEGLETISIYAVASCSKLREINIPDTVTSMGAYAFYQCSGLNKVKLSSGLKTIPTYAFANCTSLASIDIPYGVVNISEKSFFDCIAMENVTMADSVQEVGIYSFASCDALKSIDFSDNLEMIREYAFSQCTSLETADLPEAVSQISEYAFENCTALQTAALSGYVKDYAFNGCSKLETVIIRNNLKSIASGAYQHSSIKKVYVDSIKTWCGISFGSATTNPLFNAEGFYINNVLTTDVVIPFGITEIKPYTFYGFNEMTSISINNSVMEIGDYAFTKCSGLTSIRLPRALTKINTGVFKDCKKLASVQLPSVVSEIRQDAFSGCSNLETVNFPKSLKTIMTNAFYNCSSLKNAELKEGLLYLYSNAFYGCASLESVVVPDSVTSMSSGCFSGCNSLKTVKLGSGIKVINNSTFNGCTELESVTISENMATVNSNAFADCINLKYIFYGGTLSQWSKISISTSGCDTFKNASCHYQAEDHVPVNGKWMYPEGFDCETSTERVKWKICVYCDLLFDSLEIPQGHVIVDHVCENCGFSDFVYTIQSDGVTLQGYNGVLEEFNVPSTLAGYPVTSIGQSAFYGKESLKSVVIPSSVKTIGVSAFENCVNLHTISLPSSLTSIGYFSFDGARQLKVVLYEGNTSFSQCESYAFSNSVETIRVPTDYSSTTFCTIVAPLSLSWLPHTTVQGIP